MVPHSLLLSDSLFNLQFSLATNFCPFSIAKYSIYLLQYPFRIVRGPIFSDGSAFGSFLIRGNLWWSLRRVLLSVRRLVGATNCLSFHSRKLLRSQYLLCSWWSLLYAPIASVPSDVS